MRNISLQQMKGNNTIKKPASECWEYDKKPAPECWVTVILVIQTGVAVKIY